MLRIAVVSAQRDGLPACPLGNDRSRHPIKLIQIDKSRSELLATN
jgi:hypothetical protein